jgi:hypothetical protein
MPGALSAANKRSDRRTAREAAYRGSENPFPEGTRLHRYFVAARQHVEMMDGRLSELEHVYGFVGTRKSEKD